MPRLKLLLFSFLLGLPIFLLSPSKIFAIGSTLVPSIAQNQQNQAAALDITCDGGSGVNTALGCINFDLAGGGLIKSLLTLATGIGGAIALLLMLYGFFIVSTSAGIPDKVKEGQEIITGAVGGLLFIIFSVILMNLIGVQILNLPGL